MQAPETFTYCFLHTDPAQVTSTFSSREVKSTKWLSLVDLEKKRVNRTLTSDLQRLHNLLPHVLSDMGAEEWHVTFWREQVRQHRQRQ